MAYVYIKQFGVKPTYYWKIYYTDENGNKGEDYFCTTSAMFKQHNGRLWTRYNRGLTPYKFEEITKKEYNKHNSSPL